MKQDRRDFIRNTALTASSGFFLKDRFFGLAAHRTVRVVIWDERQPKQKQAYENFLGNQVAEYFRTLQGFSVQSVGLDDPEQGLPDSLLDNCDVLIWWGHVRHPEVLPEKGIAIVKRILSGSLSLIALHSAHWSTPFVEAMNEVTRIRANGLNKSHHEIVYQVQPKRLTPVTVDSRITPYTDFEKYPDGKEKWQVHLPYCVFPLARNDGKASTVRVLKAAHPVAKGIPSQFQVAQTEVYNEPFHVPEPDEVIFEERWETGEWFRSGIIWSLGKGKVFYFRPGHETHPVFKQQWPLKILSNAAQWMGNMKYKNA